MSISDRILFEQVAGVELQMFGYPRRRSAPRFVARSKRCTTVVEPVLTGEFSAASKPSLQNYRRAS
jgi:hypothetical protein